MTKTTRTALIALAFLAGSAAAASAQRTTDNPYQWWSVCGGTSSLSTCASVDIELLAPGRMQLRVWNRSGDPDRYQNATPTNTVFTGIGFYNMGAVSVSPTSLTMSGAQHLNTAGEAPDSWRIINDDITTPEGTVEGDGVRTTTGVRIEMATATQAGEQNTDDGIIRDCPPSEQFLNGDFNYWANPCNTAPNWNSNDGWVTFEFDFTGDWGDVSTTQLVVYGRDATNNKITTECVTGGAKQNCYSDVVPEPITMTLLGTGLLGVGLARRRRRKDHDIENA